jgi:hypothetical protein
VKIDLLKNVIAIFAIILVIQTCGRKRQIMEHSLTPGLSLFELTDSSFISYVYSISSSGKSKLFLDDYKDNRIIKLDDSLKELMTFGIRGRGPGEFMGAYYLQVWNDSVFCIDDEGMRMLVFDKNGNYLREFPIPRVDKQFAIDSAENFYFSTPGFAKPISVYDNNGNKKRSFGTWYYKGKTFRETRARNFRHLVITNNKLISVSVSDPIIEIYSLNGIVENKINLSEYPFISDRIRFAKNENIKSQANRESTYILFDDITCCDSTLMCTIVDGHKKCNKVLVIQIHDNNLYPVEILHLHNRGGGKIGWITSICKTNQFLYLTTYSGVINRYYMPKLR